MQIVSLPEGGKAVAGVEFTTPLGTLLTSNVAMRVDSGKSKQYPYSWCLDFGCVARFGFTSGEVASLKKGAKATLTIRAFAKSEEPIKLNLSLKGFTAAWNILAQ